MIIKHIVFHERSDADFHDYNKIWDDNRNRMIFLHTNLSTKRQIEIIFEELKEQNDILAIRFPNLTCLRRNKVYNNILSGKGVLYKDKVWHPKEVWLYNPIAE